MHIRNRPSEGWWDQPPIGRQPMNNLRMSLEGGQITGTGDDCVGTFYFEGALTEDQVVRMTKQYVARHSVDYHGRFDGHRHLYGEWWIGEFTGSWEITLLDSDARALAAETEREVGKEAETDADDAPE